MKPRYAHVPQTRTQADKTDEAVRFVWFATDRVIADAKTTGASIARMKGVTGRGAIADIDAALAKRRAGVL